jgi:thioredoxin reductase
MNDIEYHVIIIGGSYAGLSAALALGRSLRKTLVIDSGDPCNATTPHSHNFLTQDGKAPGEIATIARHQLSFYNSVSFENDLVVSGSNVKGTFEIELLSGKKARAKKLILATGIKDELLDIPGMRECWGKSVIHCPYCHGYEYREKQTAILANGEIAMHYAMLISNLTKKLHILTHGKADFTPDQLAAIKRNNIAINESTVIQIEHQRGYLTGIVLESGERLPFSALYFRPPFKQQSELLQSLGCELTEQGYLKVGAFLKTTIDGVFACGDNSSAMRSVANAISSGNLAAAAVNRELATDEF